MTNVFRKTAKTAPKAKDLIYVLGYQPEYMEEFRAKNPGKYFILTDDFIQDAVDLNAEIKDAVLHHPSIDPKKVQFYTDPNLLIADLVKRHERVQGILNFCDDYTDRTEMWLIPTIFEMFKIPFSGYAIKGTLLTHNKFYSYSIAKQLGVPVPESFYVSKANAEDLNVENFPVLVKPVNEGGSEGVNFRSVAHDADELHDVLHEMLENYDELIVGEYLPGDELTMALMRRGGENIIPITLKVLQFKNFGNDPTIYTGDFKWDEKLLGNRQLVVKVFDGDPAVKDQVIRDSIKLFQVFACKDFARVDWKCDVNGIPKFIDFNENPMYGKESSFLWCLEQADMTRRELFDAIIDNLMHTIKSATTGAAQVHPDIKVNTPDLYH
ncbi:MAG TPA: hypothetical protein VKK79_20945 [Candidatus Lokiarchaeia archaeon]|nr:hypothetical protein [Candidatus Lokiarchaeia archaeon]